MQRSNSAIPRKLSRLWQRVAIQLAGAIVGKGFTESLAELQRAQWLSPEELRARSEARLARVLRHASENVPFYQQTYRRLGLTPDQLRSIEDLRHLPIVNKDDHHKRPRSDFLALNLPSHRQVPSLTSGSTGQPFQFSLDRKAMPLLMASHTFSDAWYGMGPFDRSLQVRSPRAADPPSEGPLLVRLRKTATGSLRALYEGFMQEKISAWELEPKAAESIFRRMEAFRPAFVVGHTSAVATIADELLRRNLRLSHPIRAVITEAEPLPPSHRQVIEEFFGTAVGNRYGLRELGAHNALSCPEEPGQFHVNTELAVWETVREDGTPAGPGEVGRVLLTDLHNKVMPFIRYDTGDLAVTGETPCKCGRGFPVIRQIEGRSHECLRTPSGKLISPIALGQYLFVYHSYQTVVRHYQLLEEGAGRVRLLLVPSSGFDLEKRRQLEADLVQLLGDDVSVEVETVVEIPFEKSGKRPIIKARW